MIGHSAAAFQITPLNIMNPSGMTRRSTGVVMAISVGIFLSVCIMTPQPISNAQRRITELKEERDDLLVELQTIRDEYDHVRRTQSELINSLSYEVRDLINENIRLSGRLEAACEPTCEDLSRLIEGGRRALCAAMRDNRTKLWVIEDFTGPETLLESYHQYGETLARSNYGNEWILNKD